MRKLVVHTLFGPAGRYGKPHLVTGAFLEMFNETSFDSAHDIVNMHVDVDVMSALHPVGT